MTDWIAVMALGVQTVVLVYASTKLRKMSEIADRLVTALDRISVELDMAMKDVKTIQGEMSELEDLIRTALRE